MTFDEYQALAQRTSPPKHSRIVNGALGLSGEAGECADHVKKHLFQHHNLDCAHLAEEIGDVLWYCAELAAGINRSLDEIAEQNIAKLRERYPDGFDPERSIHRPEYEVVDK